MEQPWELTNTRADLLAIYARRGLLNPFTNPHTRLYRRLFLWALAIAPALWSISTFWLAGDGLVFLVIIVLLGAVCMLGYAFYHAFRTRLEILRWATRTEAAGTSYLWLNEEGYRLVHAGEEQVARWSAVKSVSLHTDHVIVRSVDERIYLRSSMGSERFVEFCELLRSKVPGTDTPEGTFA